MTIEQILETQLDEIKAQVLDRIRRQPACLPEMAMLVRGVRILLGPVGGITPPVPQAAQTPPSDSDTQSPTESPPAPSPATPEPPAAPSIVKSPAGGKAFLVHAGGKPQRVRLRGVSHNQLVVCRADDERVRLRVGFADVDGQHRAMVRKLVTEMFPFATTLVAENGPPT